MIKGMVWLKTSRRLGIGVSWQLRKEMQLNSQQVAATTNNASLVVKEMGIVKQELLSMRNQISQQAAAAQQAAQEAAQQAVTSASAAAQKAAQDMGEDVVR